MITDIVSLIFGSSALRRRAAAGRRTTASAARAAAVRRLPVPVLLSTAVVEPPARLQLERVPLLDQVSPPLPHLSQGEGGLARHCFAGGLSEDGVHKLRHEPAN
jgi:hypothetical protein